MDYQMVFENCTAAPLLVAALLLSGHFGAALLRAAQGCSHTRVSSCSTHALLLGCNSHATCTCAAIAEQCG